MMFNDDLDELLDMQIVAGADINAEIGVLGSMMLGKPPLRQCRAMLTEDDFWRPAHRMIFAAMVAIDDRGGNIDPITLHSELLERKQLMDIGGDDYIMSLPMYADNPKHARDYARTVADYSAKRTYKAKAQELLKLASDRSTSVDELRGFVEGIGKVRGVSGSPFVDLGSVIVGEGDEGESTGFPSIDGLVPTKGFPCGQLSIVRAYHKGGKTMFMTNCAVNAARIGKRVLYMTFADLDARQLKRRILRGMTGWSKRPLDLFKAEKFDKALEEISVQWDFSVYDASEMETGGEVESAIAWVRSAHDTKPFDLIFMDYAQELRTCERTMGEYDRQGVCASKVTYFARKLKIPVVIGSQMTPGAPGEKAKTKGSRVWEEKAGLVLSLEMTEKNLEVEIAYSRFGGGGAKANLDFDDEYLRYREKGEKRP